MALDSTTKAALIGLSSGSFTIVADTLTLTTNGVMLKYTRQAM